MKSLILSVFAWLLLACNAFKSPLPYTPASSVGSKEGIEQERRNFLATSIATATSALIWGSHLAVARASSTMLNYKEVSRDIAALVEKYPDWGPTIVRLAWHSSGTYDKMKRDGGSGKGTIRFKEELDHGGNAGLGETAVTWLEPVHAKYADAGLSYADLYTLAGGKSADWAPLHDTHHSVFIHNADNVSCLPSPSFVKLRPLNVWEDPLFHGVRVAWMRSMYQR